MELNSLCAPERPVYLEQSFLFYSVNKEILFIMQTKPVKPIGNRSILTEVRTNEMFTQDIYF